MSNKNRSIRGQVRRRDLKRRKDASDQRIQNIIEELSTTQKYPTHKHDPIQTPFGELEGLFNVGGEDVVFDLLTRHGETTRRRLPDGSWEENVPIPFDPVRRVPEITNIGENIFGRPVRGRAKLNPEVRKYTLCL